MNYVNITSEEFEKTKKMIQKSDEKNETIRVFLYLLVFISVPLLIFWFLNTFIFSSNKVDYKISDFIVNAEVQPNGDLYVEELIVQKGTFNELERSITYGKLIDDSLIYGGTDLILDSISMVELDSDVSVDLLKNNYTNAREVELAIAGDSLVYITRKDVDQNTYHMYQRTTKGTSAYIIRYTVKNVVVMHEDVAEVYWRFLDDKFEDEIDNVEIYLKLPIKDSSNYFNTWVHGTVQSNMKTIVDNNFGIGLSTTIKKFNPNKPLELRMTFDKNIFKQDNVAKHNDSEMFETLLLLEDKRVEATNREYAIHNAIYWVSLAIVGIILLYIIVSWIDIHFNYVSTKKYYYGKYNREFIDEYPIETLNYLMNNKVSDNALGAVMMNLIANKNIDCKKLSALDYSFELISNRGMSNNDAMITDFLFNTIGSDNKFNLSELKKYRSKINQNLTYKTCYTIWKNKVERDSFNNYDLYDDSRNITSLTSLYLVLSLIIFLIAYLIDFDAPIIVFPVICFMFFLYSFVVKPKVTKGLEHSAKWIAFKNFLLDFDTIPRAELPKIELWQKYMAYASAIGVADKLEIAMNVRISEHNLSNKNSNTFYKDKIFRDALNSVFNYNKQKSREPKIKENA